MDEKGWEKLSGQILLGVVGVVMFALGVYVGMFSDGNDVERNEAGAIVVPPEVDCTQYTLLAVMPDNTTEPHVIEKQFRETKIFLMVNLGKEYGEAWCEPELRALVKSPAGHVHLLRR